MFRISTEAELKKTFRPRDVRVFELPPEVRFPLYVRDVFSWVDLHGARACVVFMPPGENRPVALSFRRDMGPRPEGGVMCDWCHSFGSPDQVCMMMCEASSKRRVGVLLCRDLGCAQRVEDAADRAGRNVAAARATVVERMWRFAQEGLGITHVPE
jgi:hypothetical protein